MYYVKSCERKFNVKYCKTLFVGTLNYYRSTEDESIKDEHEGKFSQYINITDIDLPCDYMNLLVNVANSSNYVNSGSMVSRPSKYGPEYVNLSIGGFTNIIEIKNKFIFCLSLKNDPSLKIEHFDKHDDYWYFSVESLSDFCKDVATNLIKKIKEESVHRKIFEEDYSTKKLKIECIGFQVLYRDRVINLTNKDFQENPLLAIRLMQSIVFIKPEKYKPEQEFRICFEVYDGDKILTPSVKGLVIPVTSISDIVE
ncbi:TPA: hypothetical protein I3816_004014 [Enterobacter cloacae]|nr:hypothetical protein [Enterobacter cloacae]